MLVPDDGYRTKTIVTDNLKFTTPLHVQLGTLNVCIRLTVSIQIVYMIYILISKIQYTSI